LFKKRRKAAVSRHKKDQPHSSWKKDLPLHSKKREEELKGLGQSKCGDIERPQKR